jgi:hypothetical protein
MNLYLDHISDWAPGEFLFGMLVNRVRTHARIQNTSAGRDEGVARVSEAGLGHRA